MPLFASRHDQVVIYRKCIGHGLSSYFRNFFVGLRVHYALERDVAVRDEDVNRLHRLPCVFGQLRAAVDGAEGDVAYLVIQGRERKHLDLIVHVLDTFDVLDGIAGVGLQRRLSDLAEQSDGAVGGNLIGLKIKDPVVGQ